MRRLFFPVLYVLSGCTGQITHTFSSEELEKIYYLDTLEAQMTWARDEAENYNPERIKSILQELDPYYTHFRNSPRQYPREFYIYELSGLEDTRRSLTKSLSEYQKVISDLDYNLRQVRALRKMIYKSDTLSDTLRSYIDQEAIAMQETMTKFYKRIRNPLQYKDKWPALKARLDSAMRYDLQTSEN